MRFDKPFKAGSKSCVPIVPIETTWHEKNQMCKRYGIPIEPAYAITIHASQGMSLDHVIINLDNNEYSKGLTYTAISRCRKFEQMAFQPMPGLDRLTYFKNHDLFKQRLAEDKRLQKVEEENMKTISVDGVDTDDEEEDMNNTGFQENKEDSDVEFAFFESSVCNIT